MTNTPTPAARVSGTIKALEWVWVNRDRWMATEPMTNRHVTVIGETGKAAAQADYEARILAAIQPDPEGLY